MKIYIDDKPVLFICDMKRCEDCNPDLCKHTSDLEHAIPDGEKTFTLICGQLWEEIKDENIIVNTEDVNDRRDDKAPQASR
jgi:hypothetical protein